jgi:hypothetical protein
MVTFPSTFTKAANSRIQMVTEVGSVFTSAIQARVDNYAQAVSVNSERGKPSGYKGVRNARKKR